MIQSTASLEFRELIDLPLQVVRSRFGPLYRVAVAGAGIATLPPFLTLIATSDSLLSPSLTDTLLQLVGNALSGVFTIVAQMAIFFAIGEALAGRAPSVRASFAFALRPGVFFTAVLQFLAIIAGIVFCCVPGLFAMVYLSLVPAAIVFENARGSAALGRSVELVSHRSPGSHGTPMSLRVAGVLLATMLVAWSLNMITALLSVVGGVLVVLRGAIAGEVVDPEDSIAGVLWLQLLALGTGVFVTALAQLYSSSALTLLFRHARETREAPGLLARIRARVEPGPA